RAQRPLRPGRFAAGSGRGGGRGHAGAAAHRRPRGILDRPVPGESRLVERAALQVLRGERFETLRCARMRCDRPGSSRIAPAPTFAVSMQTIPGHSSSPKSAIARALAIQGFQTTVESEFSFSTVRVLPRTGSWTVHVPRVST